MLQGTLSGVLSGLFCKTPEWQAAGSKGARKNVRDYATYSDILQSLHPEISYSLSMV